MMDGHNIIRPVFQGNPPPDSSFDFQAPPIAAPLKRGLQTSIDPARESPRAHDHRRTRPTSKWPLASRRRVQGRTTTVAWEACRDAVGLGRRREAPRRSFISHRPAFTHEINQPAPEAGTSEAMVFSNHRDLATTEQSEAWFNVRPDRQLSHPPVAGTMVQRTHQHRSTQITAPRF